MLVDITGSSVMETTQANLALNGIDFAKPGYRRGWRLLGKTAQGLGVEVRPFDVTHWIMNLGIMRAIDQLVDEAGETDVSEAVAQLEDGEAIEGVTTAEAGLFAGVLNSYDDNRRQQQLDGLCMFPDFAQRRLQAGSIKELVDVNMSEAQVFADTLKVTPSPGVTAKEVERRQQLNGWLEGFSRVGYLVDSCFDMGEDYQAHNIAVEPTLGARLGIVRRALPEVISVVRQTPLVALGSIAAVAFKMNVFERAP